MEKLTPQEAINCLENTIKSLKQISVNKLDGVHIHLTKNVRETDVYINYPEK